MIRINAPLKEKVEIDGKEYEIKEPTFGDVAKLAELESLDTNEAIRAMKEVLTNCGIPNDVLEDKRGKQPI